MVETISPVIVTVRPAGSVDMLKESIAVLIMDVWNDYGSVYPSHFRLDKLRPGLGPDLDRLCHNKVKL